jgi:prepilin-type N-terminal cleavage/methylation domain-containing protein
MLKSAFTMVELIFVIVIIGILASVGIPKLSGVSDNAKKTAEVATISAVSTAIETAHGEWSINEGVFTWGNNLRSDTNPLNAHGYPTVLSKNNDTFGALLKSSSQNDYSDNGGPRYASSNGIVHSFTIFTGPASNPIRGVKAEPIDIVGKPDKNDFWIYVSEINGTSIASSCVYGGKTFFNGDFLLIDNNGINAPTLPTTLTCTN